MQLTLEQLQEIMPYMKKHKEKAEQYLPFLQAAMIEASIDTPLRVAAFLAQLAHESGELKYFEEIASGKAYEGRKDLGNTQPGDGIRFKGRGPIQLTGRFNYEECGKALGVDLVNHPERADDPDIAFRTAAWFWTKRRLNIFADKGGGFFDEITFRVNGGYNGKESRRKYYHKALEVLGAR